MTSRDPSVPPPCAVTTGELLSTSELAEACTLHAGEEGLNRAIRHPRIQKNGLLLAGHLHGVVPDRVQVFGETECSYLEALPEALRRERLAAFVSLEPSCVVVTCGNVPHPDLHEAASKSSTPLVVSKRRSSHTIADIHHVLDRMLAPTNQCHGVFVDVYGVGVLLRGESGVGKSECALALIERGHRLVADDVVILRRKPSGEVEGEGPATLRDHLEVRGLGILNVRELFGATAVRSKKRVDLVVTLHPWKHGRPYERLGFDAHRTKILEVELPALEVPVHAGRDMGLIVEVAARSRLLESSGAAPAGRLEQRLSESLGLPREEREPAREDAS